MAECIDGGAEVGQGVKPGACGTSDPPPGSCEAYGAEQVCNDIDMIVSVFVMFGADPDEADLLWEQSQLHRFEPRVRSGIFLMARLERGMLIDLTRAGCLDIWRRGGLRKVRADQYPDLSDRGRAAGLHRPKHLPHRCLVPAREPISDEPIYRAHPRQHDDDVCRPPKLSPTLYPAIAAIPVHYAIAMRVMSCVEGTLDAESGLRLVVWMNMGIPPDQAMNILRCISQHVEDAVTIR